MYLPPTDIANNHGHNLFHIRNLHIRIDISIGMDIHLQPNSINMDFRSVCFPSVCAIVCHSIAFGFLTCLVSVGGSWQRRTPGETTSSTCRRESWDFDDRRTDEHTVDNSDSSEDELDCTPGSEFVSHMTRHLSERSLTARDCCVAMWWASKAGIAEADVYKKDPTSLSGKFS